MKEDEADDREEEVIIRDKFNVCLVENYLLKF